MTAVATPFLLIATDLQAQDTAHGSANRGLLGLRVRFRDASALFRWSHPSRNPMGAHTTRRSQRHLRAQQGQSDSVAPSSRRVHAGP